MYKLALITIAITFILFFSIVCDFHHSNFSSHRTISYANELIEVEECNDTKKITRNRMWRLFNNRCERRFSENVFEMNVCRAMYRRSSRNTRVRALHALRKSGAISFPNSKLEFLCYGLESVHARGVIYVTTQIVTDSEQGRFVLELCNDSTRMTQFLNLEKITLE